MSRIASAIPPPRPTTTVRASGSAPSPSAPPVHRIDTITPRVVSTPGRAPATVSPTSPTVAIDPAHAERLSHPAGVLRMITEGDVRIRIPLRPGHYGSGMTAFDIHRPRRGEPWPEVVVYARVQNGRLVPGNTRSEFHPALDNKLWIETPSIELTPEGHLRANLDGWPDRDLQELLLGVDAVPLEMTALYDLIRQRSREMASTASAFLGRRNPFDTDRYDLLIENAVLSPGTIPTGDPNTQITLGRGTNVSLHATTSGVEMRGDFHIGRMELRNERYTLSGGQARAQGLLNLRFDREGDVSRVTTELSALSMRATGLTINDQSGANVTLGEAQLSGASLSMTVDTARGTLVGRPQLTVPEMSTRIDSGSLTTNSHGVRGTLRLRPGSVRGSFGYDGDRLQMNLAQAALRVDGENLTAGEGALRVSYANATVSGQGTLSYREGRAAFAGDLRLEGTVSDARIGHQARAFSADVAAGAAVDLRISQAAFGGTGAPLLRAQGELDVTLDSGEVLLPSGTRLTLGRSRARISLREGSIDQSGTTFRGRVELDTQLDASIDPARLSTPGVSVSRVEGTEGRVHVVLDDVEVLPDGTMRIGAINGEAHATVTRVTGRLSATAAAAARARTSRAGAASLAPGTVDTSGIVAPDPMRIIGAVQTGEVTVRVPIPAGDLYTIDGPLGTSYAPLSARSGTVATITLRVAGGLIDRSSARVSFSPTLDGPAWIEGVAVTVDSSGHFVLENSGGPDIDLTTNFLGGTTLPTTLTGMPAMAAAFSSAGGSTAVTSGLSASPLSSLSRLGVGIAVRNITFAGRPLSLGGSSFVIPSATSRFSLDISGGEARLLGHASILGAQIDTPGTNVSGISGEGDIALFVRGDGASRTISGTLMGASLQARSATIERSNGDRLELRDTHIGNASFAVGVSGGRTSFTGRMASIRTQLQPSRVTAIVGGESVPIELPAGALTNGTIDVSDTHLRASGDISGLVLRASGFRLPTAGLELSVSNPEVTVDGRLEVESGNRVHLTGRVGVSATVAGGSFGGTRDPLQLRIGRGTRAQFTLSELDLGLTPSGSVAIAGSGSVNVHLTGGRVALPSGVVLSIGRGTGGTITVRNVRRTGADRFATVEGTLRFRARVSTRIPAAGLQIAPGVRLQRIGDNNEEVDVIVNRFELQPNGQFTLGDLRLDAVLNGAGLEGTLTSPPIS